MVNSRRHSISFKWARVLLPLFLILFSLDLGAFHIIGADMYYRSLGRGKYRVTMIVYRDCHIVSQNQADYFDNPASMAIYRNRNQFFGAYSINLVKEEDVDPPDYPCLKVPPNLCVKKGTYEMEFTIPDWPSNDSYTIIYQRCCRNSSVVNVRNAQLYGASYYVEISSAAQKLANSSPSFKEFPPTAICVNEPLNYDHSATDKESDSLVYSFAIPYIGGGRQQGNGCNSILPNPPCPPPFQPLPSRAPYRYSSPLGDASGVKIDPVTGIITGTPDLKGRFVIAVSVKEYRDGIYLGEVRRDFQFNVTDCDPNVVAQVGSSVTIDEENIEIVSCGLVKVPIINNSYDVKFIQSYDWEFDIDGEKRRYTSRDVEVDFPRFGTYSGRLVLNKLLDCKDSTEITLKVYPALTADFEYTLDTCAYTPIPFTDLSSTQADRIEKWIWRFSDLEISEEQNPAHLYQNPGEKDVMLTIIDNNGCQDTISKQFSYYPVPNELVVKPRIQEGCLPDSITFDYLSRPHGEGYEISWDFGDGNTGMGLDPTNFYDELGTFDVKVKVVTPIGCELEADFPKIVNIRPRPEAKFKFTPLRPTRLYPNVTLTDQSERADFVSWMMNNEEFSTDRETSLVLDQTGVYPVSLIAKHALGCTDTLTKDVVVYPTVIYRLPNVFTPNNDGDNDEFVGSAIFEVIPGFKLQIFDRWGNIVFRNLDPNVFWNGRAGNEGIEMPPGVYVYQLEYNDPYSEKLLTKFGTVTLVR